MGQGLSLINEGWQFLHTPLETPLDDALGASGWQDVALPHDYMIADSKNLYKDGIGWYRREIGGKASGRRLIRFEGAYMDTAVFVNGALAGEWKYGYSTFEIDVTDFQRDESNLLVVRTTYISPNSRWYSGSGLYRSVWMRDVPQTYLPTDGVYIHPEFALGKWLVTFETEVIDGTGDEFIRHDILSPSGKRYLLDGGIKQTLELTDQERWDIDTPRVFRVTTSLMAGEETSDSVSTVFGLRETRFDPNAGFFLNRRNVKLRGMCMHHDLGALGAAVNRAATKRQIDILKGMGVNAIRTSHNMPSVEMVELCDEMGILLIDEAFDMWEMSKTAYDYARFFREWAERDVASWVRRDRNHPSVILFSIGNEIYDTHAGPRGAEITRFLRDQVLRYDAYHNAPVTFGSNYLTWENTQIAADEIKIVGYNYTERLYRAHHEKHPDWVIYGSETSSIVQSRGIYHFPASVPSLADDDMQCSSIGNSGTSWGAQSIETMLTEDRDTPFSMGQFAWSGFDYIGEPTPYKTKNSYFGQVDTAGFPKENYYAFRAAWTDAPMVHIAPYWDWNDGQLIDILVSTTGARVRLFLDDTDFGEKTINRTRDKNIFLRWRVPYREGVLRAESYDAEDHLIAVDEKPSFSDTVRVEISSDKDMLLADGEDMLFVTLTALDKHGRVVENAVDRVRVSVSGAGRLVGLDNGDSCDLDSYKGVSRRLFGGRLLAMIASTREAGDIELTVSGRTIETVIRHFTALPAAPRAGAGVMAANTDLPITDNDEIFIRKLSLHSLSGCHLTAQNRQDTVTANVFPVNASDQEITWRVATLAGADSNIASVAGDGLTARVTALGDGEFCLRCMAHNGYSHPRVISTLFYTVSGLGAAAINPYAFVSASNAALREGGIGIGNERGLATPSGARGMFGFENVDFGVIGSDEIALPIFGLSGDPYTLEIWDGTPECGEMLGSYVYHKPSIWNTYQEATYVLPRRLRGRHTLCFVAYNKMHIKGFSFRKYEKAYERLPAASADSVSGDDFTLAGDSILDIGNNVTVAFDDMDFGAPERLFLTVSGRADSRNNTLQLRMTNAKGETTVTALECPASDAPCDYRFAVPAMTGECTVRIIFLPGSRFDLDSIQFTH